MSTKRPTVPVALVRGATLFALLALAACAGDAGDWKRAQQADTQAAYDAFVAKYPDSEFAAQARERAAQLAEQRDWDAATRADTPEAYQKFVAQHADGKWTEEARIRIENFNLMAASAPEAPAETVAPNAAAPAPVAARAVRAASAPRPVAAKTPAPAAGATGDGARVQLGAFSSVDKAEAEWTRARARFTTLQALEPRITPAETRAGRLFRLQAALPDADAAKALCDELKAAGQACLVVPSK
jgi:cell division septation protein DedD